MGNHRKRRALGTREYAMYMCSLHHFVWVRASLRLPYGDGEGELHGKLTVRELHRSLPLAELHMQFVALLVHQADQYRDGSLEGVALCIGECACLEVVVVRPVASVPQLTFRVELGDVEEL